MNDHDRSTNNAENPETVDRLRRTFAAVAAGVPTEDRSAELVAALARHAEHGESVPPPGSSSPGGPPGAPADADLIALAPIAANRPFQRWLLAIAAGLVVVVGLGLALRNSDGARAPVGSTPGGPETGWFVPAAGWQITSVQTDFLDVGEAGACPCLSWTAARPGSSPAAITVEETAAPDSLVLDLPEPVQDVTVGGRDGEIGELSAGLDLLVVRSGGRQLLVYGSGVERDALVALADHWLDGREGSSALAAADIPLPDGFERAGLVERPDVRSEHLVVVRVEQQGTGREVEYRFVPTGFDRNNLHLADSVTFDDGTFRAVHAADDGAPAIAVTGGTVDLVVGPSFFGESIDPLPIDALLEFVDGLRQVTTAEWREALASAPGDVDAGVLAAETLFESPLVEG